MNKKIFLLMMALFLLAGRALALGVTPGKTVINFEPGLERTVELTVLNNEQKDLSLALNVEGELSKYVSLTEKDIHLSPSEVSKTIKYNVKLPEKIDKPGTQETRIVLRETKSVTEQGVSVGASLSVASILDVNVPYEGKYAEANLFVTDQEGETIFVVEITNYGKEDIKKANASIEIFEGDKNIGTIQTDERPVEQETRKELTSKWGNAKPGTYKAKAKISYDDKTIEAEKEFKTGGFFIKLIDVAVKNFNLGQIAKFQVLLENVANEKSEEVYTKMTLDDKTGKKIMDIESQRTELQSQERKEVQAYWDTETVEKGKYNGKAELHANKETWEAPMSMEVQENEIKTSIGPTAMAVAETKTGYKTTPLIGLLVIALIIANIVWYLYYKKKTRK